MGGDPFGGVTYQISWISDIYTLIHNSRKIIVTKQKWNKFIAEVTTTRKTVLMGHSIRMVEKPCSRCSNVTHHKKCWFRHDDTCSLISSDCCFLLLSHSLKTVFVCVRCVHTHVHKRMHVVLHVFVDVHVYIYAHACEGQHLSLNLEFNDWLNWLTNEL